MVHIKLAGNRTVSQPKFLKLQRFLSDNLIVWLFSWIVYSYLKRQLTRGSPVLRPCLPSLDC